MVQARRAIRKAVEHAKEEAIGVKTDSDRSAGCGKSASVCKGQILSLSMISAIDPKAGAEEAARGPLLRRRHY
jgi:hypothetical protein